MPSSIPRWEDQVVSPTLFMSGSARNLSVPAQKGCATAMKGLAHCRTYMG